MLLPSRSSLLGLWLATHLVVFSGTPVGARAAGEVVLSPDEVEALTLRLVEAKPNLATVAISAFVFPGAAQAQMGRVDHTLALWGGYLATYTVAKAFLPDTLVSGGQRVSDWVVLGAFVTMASASAFDAYRLAQARRAAYDAVLNRLSDKAAPLSPGSLAPVDAPGGSPSSAPLVPSP